MRIVKGWMLKMVGNNIYPKSGEVVTGKYGKYLIRDRIGRGGNGTVFTADIVEGGEMIPQRSGYAIKFLAVTLNDENESEKRRSRFIKEIEEVLSFQNSVKGIIPIYDTSISCKNQDELLWYLMPKAEPFIPKKYSVSQKLMYMSNLGNCIRELHRLGYAHRDIKTKNLLLLEGMLCLADFGLVWNSDHMDEHITEINDRLGPQAIRPPELSKIGQIDGIDYRKSDVYLYAKTIWMVLYCNNGGFPSEYSRMSDSVYIDKEEFQMETAEPLHLLMEGATKHNYWERIDIDDCISYVENQRRVISGKMPQDILARWKYDEQVKRMSLVIPSDEKVYKEPVAIVRILNSMSGVAGIIFTEAGKDYSLLPLRKVNHIENNLFEIQVLNPYFNGKKKVIEMAISKIVMDKDMSYVIHSVKYSFNNRPVPLFEQVIKALQSPDRRIRLNSSYVIRMSVK